jgi:hypothetical protein
LAYNTMFYGQSELQGARYLWKLKAPEFKFFFWLAMQGRCWTSERLHRHGLASDASCALCSQAEESTDHLLLGCIFTREVWTQLLQPLGWHHVIPAADSVLGNWWVDAWKRIGKPRRRVRLASIANHLVGLVRA